MSQAENSGRIAIIGAGSVGATIAYALMLRGLAHEIVLVDANAAKAEGEVKNLNHGLRFVPSVKIAAGTIADVAGSQIIVITAGAKQKPGQSRLDLAATNVGILREMIPQLVDVSPRAILLVVSNPVDVLTYAATKLHPDGPRRVLGSGTVLDTSRFVTLIADQLGISVANVHAQIVGEHGESELPLWSSAHVGNVPLHEFYVEGHGRLSVAQRAQIIASVRSAAGEIIAAKGATNWAIGLATARIIEAVRRNESAILTVSRRLENYYGISDVCLSVPCVVNRVGAEQTIAVRMDGAETVALQASAQVVREACRRVGL